MTNAQRIGSLVLLGAFMAPVSAADFNYTYGQVDYLSGDFDGFALSGSYAINNEMFIRGAYTALSEDETVLGNSVDLDYTQFDVGVGYHMPLNPQADLVVTGSLVRAEVDVYVPFPVDATVSDDETGLLLTGGVRFQPAPQVEVSGNVYHISVFDGDTGLQAEGRYYFDERMSAGVGVSTGDYLDNVGINFRMGF